MGKRVGIITLHHSYNCGSMMQAYALQTVVNRLGHKATIFNFSNERQRILYHPLFPLTSPKNIAKNILLFPRKSRIVRNCYAYESFITKWLNLDKPTVFDSAELVDDGYDVVIAGSDQIWNVAIEDSDDAYFLPWVNTAKRVAYVPSFGAKNPAKFSDDPQRYANYIRRFDSLSIRERNGQEWIRALAGIDVPVLLDPTLLLDIADYEQIEELTPSLPQEYLFYYSPGYTFDVNHLVRRVSKQYELPVIAFNAKSFFVKGMNVSTPFRLPAIESPATYLSLIKNAKAVFTTSFHGTIFSTIYRRPFWTVKNGGMFGNDDRVSTLVSTLHIEDRVCSAAFDSSVDYLAEPNWDVYKAALEPEREKSLAWLAEALK